MTAKPRAGHDLLARAGAMPIRIVESRQIEEPDYSSQHLRCEIRRQDVEDGAIAVIFAIAALSFHDARPRGSSHIDYVERDEWTPDDLCGHLRFQGGSALLLETDYVRGRMMKTKITVWPTGVVEIVTRNRHQMATRWVETLQGKAHLRLVADDTHEGP